MKAISGKPKKCKSCRCEFVPSKPLQVACGVKCALDLARAKQAKQKRQEATKERAEHAKRKEATKTKAQHAKEAQAAFNAWVRLRDQGKGCISCGTTADLQYAAGHYRTVGSCPELRFEPLNVHLQCNRNCNMGKSGNILEYRINLIKRIGLDKVEWLEGKHEPKRYTVEDLKAIKAKYRALVREMQKAG
jgi:hypothetical protein